MIIFGKL